MNSDNNILYRLLKLYPVQTLKENFLVKTKTQNSIIQEIVLKYQPEEIYNFSYKFFNYTRQHIYFFNNDTKDLNLFETALLSTVPLFKNTKSDGEITQFYFYNTTYSVIIVADRDNFSRTDIDFKVPMKMTITKNYLRLDFTIIEKNINAYINTANRIINFGKTIDEKYILLKLKSESTKFKELNPYDLNKGIKHLWKNDLIDSPFVKWKKSRSISTEAMDEEFTLKEQYPELFDEIIYAPLKRTIFNIRNGDKNSYNHFISEPSEGKISLTTFAKNKDAKENVISQILTNN